MAGNGIQVGSDGGIRVKDNGIVVAGDGDPCCCGEVVYACNCNGGPIKAYADVVISGVTSGECEDFVGVSGRLEGTINGTYTNIPLATPGAVGYSAIISAALRYRQYASTACSGGTVIDTTDGFSISIVCGAGRLNIQITYVGFPVLIFDNAVWTGGDGMDIGLACNGGSGSVPSVIASGFGPAYGGTVDVYFHD